MALFRDYELINHNRPASEAQSRVKKKVRTGSVLRTLIASELILFATIAICTIVLHSNQVNIYGISYFGVRLETLPIVATGFSIGGFLLVYSSKKLPTHQKPWQLIQLTLRVVGIGIVLLLLTPYTVDTFFNWTHMIIGALIFALQMYCGIVITLRFSADRISKLALLVEFIGGVLAMFSLPDNMLNFMLEGEVIFQVGFMIQLNRAVRHKLATIQD